MTALILAIMGITLFALCSAVDASCDRALVVATKFAAYRRRLAFSAASSSGPDVAGECAFAAFARRVLPEPDPFPR